MLFHACLVFKDANEIHSILVFFPLTALMLFLCIFDILPVTCHAEGLLWLNCLTLFLLLWVLRFDFLNVS